MKNLIIILLFAIACNHPDPSTVKKIVVEDIKTAENANQMKIEYYPDGALYREINLRTLDAKIYTRNGKLFLKGKFNDTSFKLNGVWEEWDRFENYKRFQLTFKNNMEEGAFTSFKKDGKIYVKGFKKGGVFSDTLKYYDNEEKLFELQIWKPDASQKEGTKLVNTIHLSSQRSDGTIERIKGKLYRWENGVRLPMDSN